MNMKFYAAVGAICGLLLGAGGLAFGYNSGGHIEEATVIDAVPVYRTVRINNPRQQCWEEAVSVPTYTQGTTQSRTPEILGAIVGAGVGRLFGSGRGQDLATVAGAVLGGSIGHDVNNRKKQTGSEVRYEQRCKTVDEYHTEERLQGYDVTYEYNGNVYSTRTDNDPGSTLKVSVNVVPVE
jgi:uncharacterized protein YcfJ